MNYYIIHDAFAQMPYHNKLSLFSSGMKNAETEWFRLFKDLPNWHFTPHSRRRLHTTTNPKGAPAVTAASLAVTAASTGHGNRQQSPANQNRLVCYRAVARRFLLLQVLSIIWRNLRQVPGASMCAGMIPVTIFTTAYRGRV